MTVLKKHMTASNIIIWITVFALAGLFSLPSMLKRGSGFGDDWTIRINKRYISDRQFRREVAEQQEHLNRFRAQYGQFADMFLQSMGIDPNPQSLAYDTLVRNELIVQLAESMGIMINHEYIAQKINDQDFVYKNLGNVIPPFVFLSSGEIDQRLLSSYVKQRGLTMPTFEKMISEALLKVLLLHLLESTVYVPDYIVAHDSRIKNAQKKYSLFTFSLEDYLDKAKKNTILEDEVKTYFDNQNAFSKRYWTPEKRIGLQWSFDATAYDIDISNEELFSYYEDNKSRFYVENPTKVEVRQIVLNAADTIEGKSAFDYLSEKRQALVNNPETFSQIAQEISVDKESSKKGGLLKPFSRGELNSTIEKAAFVLQQDLEISPIVEYNNQLFLLQRVSKASRTYKPFEKVKKEIERVVKAQQFKEIFAQEVQAVLNEKTADQEKLESFIERRRGKKSKIEAFGQGKTNAEQTLFKLNLGEMAFYAEGQTGILVQLTEIEPKSLPNFSSIKDVVLNDLYEEKAYEALQNDVLEARRLLMSDKSVDSVIHQFGIKQEKTDWIEPDTKKGVSLFDKKGISLDQIQRIEKVGGILLHRENRAIHLIRLEGIQELELTNDLLKKSKQAVDGEYKRTMLEGLVASLFRNATIEVNKNNNQELEDFLYE